MRPVFRSRMNRGVAMVAGATLAVMMAAGVSFEAQQAPTSITVYKTPTCGCCSRWVDHLSSHGFNVRTMDVEDIEAVKSTYGVPRALGSCHTAVVGNYVVEGHVPGDAVARMLRERPAIAGIAVPGMPMGSPGMEVPGQSQPYDIVSFDRSGKYQVYERR